MTCTFATTCPRRATCTVRYLRAGRVEDERPSCDEHALRRVEVVCSLTGGLTVEIVGLQTMEGDHEGS